MDLFIQNLSEGTSYLTTVTPVNKKGVGKSTHVIVDTLRHPAVELTQAEGAAASDGTDILSSAQEDNGGSGDDDWAVVTGALVGTAGCLAILVVATVVIRFCVCPASGGGGGGVANGRGARGGSYASKTDLSNGGSSPNGPHPAVASLAGEFGEGPGGGSLSLASLDVDATAMGRSRQQQQQQRQPSARKGILKHHHQQQQHCPSASLDGGLDCDLARMVEANPELIPPPPFPGGLTTQPRSYPTGVMPHLLADRGELASGLPIILLRRWAFYCAMILPCNSISRVTSQRQS